MDKMFFFSWIYDFAVILDQSVKRLFDFFGILSLRTVICLKTILSMNILIYKLLVVDYMITH